MSRSSLRLKAISAIAAIMTAAEVELPKRLTTDSEDGREQVPVDMAATMNYAPEDIDKLKDVLGMSTFTGARLRAIRDVGLNVEAFGFLRYLKGGTAMTVESILSARKAALGARERPAPERRAVAVLLHDVEVALVEDVGEAEAA